MGDDGPVGRVSGPFEIRADRAAAGQLIGDAELLNPLAHHVDDLVRVAAWTADLQKLHQQSGRIVHIDRQFTDLSAVRRYLLKNLRQG